LVRKEGGGGKTTYHDSAYGQLIIRGKGGGGEKEGRREITPLDSRQCGSKISKKNEGEGRGKKGKRNPTFFAHL